MHLYTCTHTACPQPVVSYCGRWRAHRSFKTVRVGVGVGGKSDIYLAERASAKHFKEIIFPHLGHQVLVGLRSEVGARIRLLSRWPLRLWLDCLFVQTYRVRTEETHGIASLLRQRQGQPGFVIANQETACVPISIAPSIHPLTTHPPCLYVLFCSFGSTSSTSNGGRTGSGRTSRSGNTSRSGRTSFLGYCFMRAFAF